MILIISDKKKKVGLMKRSDIKGEEWNVPEDEEEEKMMPFNMDKDLEEGYIYIYIYNFY